MEIVKKHTVKDLLCYDERYDYRKIMDSREVIIENTFSTDSVVVRLGETMISANISKSIFMPSKNQPNKGKLRFHVIKSKFTNENNSKGDPSNFISQQLDTMFKNSQAIDLESICILVGKKALELLIMLRIINDNGNALEACSIAVVSLLLKFNNFAGIADEPAISLLYEPYLFSYGIIKDSNDRVVILVDPSKIEQEAISGYVRIGCNNVGKVCYLYKNGSTPVDAQNIETLIKLSIKRSAELNQLISLKIGVT